jgi:hypothetical protein
MGVEVIHNRGQAVLICNTTDWAFGPVFRGSDAEEQAEAFLRWFSEDAEEAAVQCGILIPIIGTDPRMYTDTELECLYGKWKEIALDKDGFLKEVPHAAA